MTESVTVNMNNGVVSGEVIMIVVEGKQMCWNQYSMIVDSQSIKFTNHRQFIHCHYSTYFGLLEVISYPSPHLFLQFKVQTMTDELIRDGYDR